jgi:hypothetical protein
VTHASVIGGAAVNMLLAIRASVTTSTDLAIALRVPQHRVA